MAVGLVSSGDPLLIVLHFPFKFQKLVIPAPALRREIPTDGGPRFVNGAVTGFLAEKHACRVKMLIRRVLDDAWRFFVALLCETTARGRLRHFKMLSQAANIFVRSRYMGVGAAIGRAFYAIIFLFGHTQ